MSTGKNKTIFVCQECGFESPKWLGQCECGAWGSFVEEKVVKLKDSRSRDMGTGLNNPVKLSSVQSFNNDRYSTDIEELNRVLGGGLVKGSLTLIAGEPGIGKSTLILQTAINIAKEHGKVLYVSGEESVEQIKIRADRLSPLLSENLYILSETNMDSIMEVALKIKPVFLIIDSIQTMYSDSLDSASGSVSQVRNCTHELMKLGKAGNIPIFIVAHVTKAGDLAGPKIVEHLVDTVLHFSGERTQDLRILRSNKNRFGTTSEIGAFEMSDAGLIEVKNLSGNFLEEMDSSNEGSVATAVYEGTRPLIMEIQALTAPANAGFARRSAIGVELNRLNMIVAVLEKKANLSLINYDVYVNIVGGLRPEGTSFDLAVALAIYSSFKSVKSDKDTLIFGEIGLTGDLRSVRNADKIISEAEKLGFKRIILPAKNANKLKSTIKLIGVSNLSDALRVL